MNTFGYVGGSPLLLTDSSGLAYVPKGRAGHGELYWGISNVPVQSFIMDMPLNALEAKSSNINCSIINKGGIGGTESRVCAGRGYPPDTVWGYDGDVDFFKISGRWYKIHTGDVYPAYNRYGALLFNGTGYVTSGLGLSVYYLLNWKAVNTSGDYINKISQLVYPGL